MDLCLLNTFRFMFRWGYIPAYNLVIATTTIVVTEASAIQL